MRLTGNLLPAMSSSGRAGFAFAQIAVHDFDFDIVVIGGETIGGPLHIWWNFVSSRPERIEQAKADCRTGLRVNTSMAIEMFEFPTQNSLCDSPDQAAVRNRR